MLMVLLAANFDNLQSYFTESVCGNDAALLTDDRCRPRACRAGCSFLCGISCMAGSGPCRTRGCLSASSSIRSGTCIMFFPTLVLGTLNSILSPVVKGTHTILESQTFDMNEYRAQKDKLEMEAMKRNPETAYLVDKEAFDNKLDELGALDA